ncbi:MAG: DoxX family protein [Roseibium album]|uniref:DoxX family protein n=1 Tax=Roseibium album TaxID=311410 RepID=UPI0032F05DCA
MSRFDTILRIATILLSTILVGLSIYTFFQKPIAIWTVFSISVFLSLLTVSLILTFQKQAEFFATIAVLFSALVIGRLFSTMHFEAPGASRLSDMDPLMIAETGPGVASIMWASTALSIALGVTILRFVWRQSRSGRTAEFMGKPTPNDWGLTFIRIYVGLMFIAHFAGHLFAGPMPFEVFVDYFDSIGLPVPTAFVILAGVIELAVTIGLAFGLLTRIAAVGAAVYLFVSVGLGGHYSVGYIWVLPTGGWEFPALWIFAVSIFAFTGGGPASIDRLLVKAVHTMPQGLRRLLA